MSTHSAVAPAIHMALPKYSNGDIDEALIREIKTGFHLHNVQEEERQNAAAREAQWARRDKSNTPFGKKIMQIPEFEFFKMGAKYGWDEVHSKGFMKYMQKNYDNLSVSKI